MSGSTCRCPRGLRSQGSRRTRPGTARFGPESADAGGNGLPPLWTEGSCPSVFLTDSRVTVSPGATEGPGRTEREGLSLSRPAERKGVWAPARVLSETPWASLAPQRCLCFSKSLPSPTPFLCPSLGPLPLVPASPLGLPGGACAESGPRLTRWLLSCHQQLQGVAGGRPLGREAVSTVASVLAPVDGAHWAQGEVGLSEPHLGPPGRALREVLSPHLGQSESGVANVRATLEGQVLSRGEDRALRGQEGGLPRQPWGETCAGL